MIFVFCFFYQKYNFSCTIVFHGVFRSEKYGMHWAKTLNDAVAWVSLRNTTSSQRLQSTRKNNSGPQCLITTPWRLLLLKLYVAYATYLSVHCVICYNECYVLSIVYLLFIFHFFTWFIHSWAKTSNNEVATNNPSTLLLHILVFFYLCDWSTVQK